MNSKISGERASCFYFSEIGVEVRCKSDQKIARLVNMGLNLSPGQKTSYSWPLFDEAADLFSRSYIQS